MVKYLVMLLAVTVLLLASCRQTLQPSDEMLHGTNDGSGAGSSESSSFDQPTHHVTNGTDLVMLARQTPQGKH